MANRPHHRINFVVAQYDHSIIVTAYLYEREEIVATAQRRIPITADEASYVRVAELMDATEYLVSRVGALREQPALPF